MDNIEGLQKAIIEMQQQMLALVIRVSCLEELLVSEEDGATIKKEQYKAMLEKGITKANSILTDKIKTMVSKDNDDNVVDPNNESEKKE